VIVRAATDADLPAIRDLFNALIETTTIAWRDDLATSDEMEMWFADRRRLGHPVFVAEIDGVVVGYTCWSAFRGFPGYRHTAELTVHVRVDNHRQGIGRRLLTELIAEAERRGVHVLVAGIDAANDASIALHGALGFREVARLPEVGAKFGRWLDLVLMHRIITTAPTPPA
jgi:phosphinothricin acetyltransferase